MIEFLLLLLVGHFISWWLALAIFVFCIIVGNR